jgi:tetratricopeptide (TPR) repeat protein
MVAEHLLSDDDPDLATTLDAGFHLLLGGDERRGAEILRKVGLELVESDELPEAIPALEAAVAVYRKLDRPRNELCGLIHPLAFGGYYVERRLAEQYGEEALELLAQETGLALSARLRRYLGKYLALLVGLIYAVVLHLFSGRGGLRGLSRLIATMGGVVGSLTGAAVVCLDSAGASRIAAKFEPFEPLSLRHAGAFCYVLSKTLVGVTEDRAWQTIAALRGLLARLDTRWGVLGFPDRMKPLTRGGVLYALGALEGFMDEPVALTRADELEKTGLRLYDMVACQIRANYYYCQGDVERAREYERQVEVHATRNGSTWQAEVWAPSSRLVAYRRTRDLIGLKRGSEELDRLAQEIPSLERYARIARTILMGLHGEHHAAIPALEQLISETAPHGFTGWTMVAAGLADAYNKTGQHARAEALCTRIMAGLDEDDRRVVSLTLDIELELAHAEVGLGRTAAAAARLDALIRKHEVNRAAITMGSIHRARAEVAIAAGDEDSARYHRALMDNWFRSTKNPSLIAECERVRAAAEATSVRPEPEGREELATVLERVASPSEDETSGPANTEVDSIPAAGTARQQSAVKPEDTDDARANGQLPEVRGRR